MEIQGQGGGGGGGGGGLGGGGEVRRLHIIYFLSRKGQVDHPHLIRVHHFSKNGVRLRDVKRWLSELRGKDIPELFAWSYKRRYKTGYVWQDLVDEDLITPISDNEYVLKGSEIASSSSCDICSYCERKVSPPLKIEGHPETKMDISTYESCEIEEQSPPFSSETSTMTDDSMKLDEEKKKFLDTTKEHAHEKVNKFDHPSSFFYSNLLNTKNKKKNKKDDKDNNKEKTSTPDSSSFSTFKKSRSYSSGASSVFRNLITCGGSDIKDSVTVVKKKSGKSSSNVANNRPSNDTAEICKGDKMGGSERTFGTLWNQPNVARKSCDEGNGSKKNMDNKNEFSQKPVSAYKPVNGPNCSQCGKTFKPEKMHTHMKSCKGIKYSLGKATAEKTLSHGSSMDSSHQESVSAYFLTH
ncbi:protein SOSEKI 1-like [Cornus florida]|uniref:protein SOSEKI 1-like n=1 Tax=Cornus florida TaxID=4283 RepID=UPI002898D22C|nr:protein SOSEKI 1-like [Cornus florida]